MKQYIHQAFAILLFVCATSCGTTKYLSIDVLQPARVVFPENIVNVAIVDNAGVTLDSAPNTGDTELETFTSIGKNTFVNSLQQFMQEEEYFYDVKLYPQVMRTDKDYEIQVPLLKSQVQDIAREVDADAIISIDTYFTENSTTTVMDVGGYAIDVSKIANTLLFRIYDSNGELMAPIMISEDSVFRIKKDDFALKKQHHKQLALQFSEGMMRQLIPSWQSQERRYYTDGTKAMKQANALVEQNGNWTEAAKIWGAAFEQVSDTKQKARLAANIALANENLDDIENAANWVRIASNLINTTSKDGAEYQYINWYKTKLLEREQHKPKVLEQIGEE